MASSSSSTGSGNKTLKKFKNGDTAISMFKGNAIKKPVLKEVQIIKSYHDQKLKEWKYYVHWKDEFIKHDKWLLQHLLAPVDDHDAQQRLLLPPAPSDATTAAAAAAVARLTQRDSSSRPSGALYSIGAKMMALWYFAGRQKRLGKVRICHPAMTERA